MALDPRTLAAFAAGLPPLPPAPVRAVASSSPTAGKPVIGTAVSVDGGSIHVDSSTPSGVPPVIAHLGVEAFVKTAALISIQAAMAPRARTGLAFPFVSVAEYVRVMRLRWRLSDASFERAKREIDAYLGVETEDYVSRSLALGAATDFGNTAMKALGAGVTGLGLGAAIGSGFGPIGSVIGGAIGFVVGFCVGLIPFEKIQFLSDARKRWDAMVAVERYMMLGRYREAMDAARKSEGQSLWPAWRTGYSTGALFQHSEFEGVGTVALFSFQDLWDRQAVPAPSSDPRDPLLWYLAGVCASVVNDDQKFTDSELWNHVKDRKGPAWLRERCETEIPLSIVAPAASVLKQPYRDDYVPRGTTVRITDLRAGTVRKVLTMGSGGVQRMPDYADVPLTEPLRQLVLARNDELKAKGIK